jgi:ribosomal-protein-alanine N-acetyltransferase
VNVFLRTVENKDAKEFLSLMRASRTLHNPWISPPLDRRTFDAYLSRVSQEDHEGLLVCETKSEHIVGVININNIVRSSFLSASLGYYIGQTYLGKGYMLEALTLVKNYAFTTQGLHRLEANIQPDNIRSINLVKRSGFVYEGLSKNYLYLSGQWRDHERWAIYDTRTSLSP